MKRLITIVVPVYNEEGNIKAFYTAINEQIAALRKYDFQILFIDDGSVDQSRKEIHRLEKKDDRVSCIEFVRNFGKETATSAGLHSAKGDAVIMIDADLQHPVELIGEFVTRWEDGADVVTGVREENQHLPVYKKIRSSLFYHLLNKIADTKLVPNGTDYQLLDRAVVDEFNRFTERGRITRGLIGWLGFPTEYVYFSAKERLNGESNYSTLKLFRLAINSFISMSLFPLKLAGYLGMFISFFAGVVGAYMYVDRFILSDPLGFNFSGTALLAVLILFLVGILLSCLGLIALYIGTIHGEVINRPMYVVRRKRRA